ncbi:MAG: hypothetical protein ABIS35_03450 [Terracoccus sp.]
MSEDQLRKVLSTMDEIEPPTDDLFAQRALMRGRARTARRRGVVFGAAAGLVVAASLGGVWVVQHSGDASTTSAASGALAGPEIAPELAAPRGTGSGSDGAGSQPSPESTGRDLAAGGGTGPGVSAARDGSTWFTGPMTAQRSALESLEPMLESDHPEVFSGAYAADPTNTRVVVVLTRRDPQLEATVAAAFPAAADVSFAVAPNSIATKRAVMERIRQDTAQWAASGITIDGVDLDGRSDRVVVRARPRGGDPATLDAVTQRYGAGLVQVVPDLTPTGKLPDGSTIPPPQR